MTLLSATNRNQGASLPTKDLGAFLPPPQRQRSRGQNRDTGRAPVEAQCNYTVSHKKEPIFLSVTSKMNEFQDKFSPLDLKMNGTCDNMNFTHLN